MKKNLNDDKGCEKKASGCEHFQNLKGAKISVEKFTKESPTGYPDLGTGQNL